MKAQKRYLSLLIFLIVAFSTVVYFRFHFKQSNYDYVKNRKEWKMRKRKSYLEESDIWTMAPLNDGKEVYVRKSVVWRQVDQKTGYRHPSRQFELAANCRFSNCFDFSKCKPGDKLRIHIYPSTNSNQMVVSETYQKVLNVIRSSIYYEPDPSKACIFVTRYDTLDRDLLSPEYKKNLPNSFPMENGRNHLLFNLYSGSWPNYSELDFSSFNPGYAIIVKASTSYTHYRPGFDISIPLFSKSHPEKGSTLSVMPNNGATGSGYEDISVSSAASSLVSQRRTNLLVFKGKRYIYGIGSETRNALHHLHNDKDILMFTTCKHGKKWKELKDERCARDNHFYDQFDYATLLSNSTFCLVPRGRRLGSFRFLEALSYGCIPVLLSNFWVKPFEDVIDWSGIVIDGDERNLLQLPEILRSVSWKKIAKMRSQSLAVYEAYFSSVEKIVLTTIAVLSERIQSHLSLHSFIWNLVNPGFSGFFGAIWFDTDYSSTLYDYPGYRVDNSFTAVIYVNRAINPANLHKLLKTISRSRHIARIILLWALPVNPPISLTRISALLSIKIPINLIIPKIKTINAKLYPYELIQTDAVLSLDPESNLSAEELDFAFLVWQSFPHRIVGFTCRDHYYDDLRSAWFYTSKWTNHYSMVLLDAAFYHRYYSWLYTHHISANIALNLGDNENAVSGEVLNNDLLLEDNLCLDLVFNFLVSHVTREGPIKVTQRKKTSNMTSSMEALNLGAFTSRQKCFSLLIKSAFAYLPLIKSQTRFDPLLFKDPVSNFRKKYRRLEQVT